MSHAEHDFFTATDIEARADAFADLDVGARSERLLGPLLAGLGALGLAAVFLLRPGAPAPEGAEGPPPKAPAVVAAAPDEAKAPRIEPVVVGRAAPRALRGAWPPPRRSQPRPATASSRRPRPSPRPRPSRPPPRSRPAPIPRPPPSTTSSPCRRPGWSASCAARPWPPRARPRRRRRWSTPAGRWPRAASKTRSLG
ncbi:MAG: hypothetical protein H6704_09745 [Myxococcales bacterium]|nr:hypothetical protein [Myxococcales bacterium]